MNGLIGCFGLEDWWKKELTEEERQRILNGVHSYQPENYPLHVVFGLDAYQLVEMDCSGGVKGMTKYWFLVCLRTYFGKKMHIFLPGWTKTGKWSKWQVPTHGTHWVPSCPENQSVFEKIQGQLRLCVDDEDYPHHPCDSLHLEFPVKPPGEPFHNWTMDVDCSQYKEDQKKMDAVHKEWRSKTPITKLFYSKEEVRQEWKKNWKEALKGLRDENK